MANDDLLDLLIIGGGINGAGIARDAAGRGLKVLLCEQSDLASGTSSTSSKLIHGGLRYLEMYEFRLVREALAEREILLALAPHIIWPLRFVLPHDESLRPAWLVRLGLFLYDHIGGRRTLPGTHSLDFTRAPEGSPLRPEFRRGFAYSDCWVEDSRLVVLNAMDAAERGATILTRTRCVAAKREDGVWSVRLKDLASGAERTVRAKVLVNAAGPWVGGVLSDVIGRSTPAPVRLVKGSHIVVPKLYEGAHAFILQNTDRRVIFTIPYEGEYTLVGTTDIPYEGDPAKVAASEAEVEYLCAAVNRAFRKTIAPADVVHRFAGIRPLYDDSASSPSAVTRDYVFDLTGDAGEAPLLSIYGGKITTYRRLAEHAMEKLSPFLPGLSPAWTAAAALPGGDVGPNGFEAFAADVQRRRPWLPTAVARRLCRLYGSRVERLLGNAASLDDLGRHFGAGLYEAEISYLLANEWARTAEDVLWRRTRLGLHVSPQDAERLAAHLEGGQTIAAAGE